MDRATLELMLLNCFEYFLLALLNFKQLFWFIIQNHQKDKFKSEI